MVEFVNPAAVRVMTVKIESGPLDILIGRPVGVVVESGDLHPRAGVSVFQLEKERDRLAAPCGVDAGDRHGVTWSGPEVCLSHKGLLDVIIETLQSDRQTALFVEYRRTNGRNYPSEFLAGLSPSKATFLN